MVGTLPLQGRYIIFFAGAEHYCLREEYHFQFKPEWVNLFMIIMLSYSEWSTDSMIHAA